MNQNKKLVYLAGPDVFRDNAIDHGIMLKIECARADMVGMYPFDNEVNPPDAKKIFEANFDMIKRCDVVVANISPFRGPGMDAGTAWEIGAAVALGKKVVLYTSDNREYKTRVGENTCEEYPYVEDFGLAENLMIACSGNLHSSFQDAIKEAAEFK